MHCYRGRVLLAEMVVLNRHTANQSYIPHVGTMDPYLDICGYLRVGLEAISTVAVSAVLLSRSITRGSLGKVPPDTNRWNCAIY